MTLGILYIVSIHGNEYRLTKPDYDELLLWTQRIIAEMMEVNAEWPGHRRYNILTIQDEVVDFSYFDITLMAISTRDSRKLDREFGKAMVAERKEDEGFNAE